MDRYRGLTWDHPRGRVWLEAANALWRERGVEVVWDTQPLEGFETNRIDELCAEYDLVVLDHPHVGDAVATLSLQSLESIFGDAAPALDQRYAGPSLDSYKFDGGTWALPIDAATQVSARDPRVVEQEPCTWDDVERLAGEVPVALSLAGPHAILNVFSVASALGSEPRDMAGAPWLEERIVVLALEILGAVHERARHEYAMLNPIGLLERLGSDDPLAYVPLVYGYVNYSLPTRARPVAFANAPRVTDGGLPGSTIGGTGIAVSRRAIITDVFRGYLEWIVSDSTQRRVVPEFEGQPAAARAWSDVETDTGAGHFYSNTRETIEASVVRPRYAGFPGAQQKAAAIVRAALAGDLAHRDAAGKLTALAISSRFANQEVAP